MAKENELKLKLTAEDNISTAVKKISTALGQTELGRSITAASTAFLALKGAAEIVGSVMGKVTDAVKSTVAAAAAAEVSDRKLAAALVQTGNYSEDAYNKIQALSGALQAQTGVSDEVSKDLVTLGLNMGMTAEEAQNAAKAAIDMGAALNVDAETALKQIGQTLSGTTGLLSKTIPAIKGLTQAQLASGAAVDLIAKKYQGFAAASSQNFDGALKKSTESWGDVLEQIGFFVTKNPVVLQALNKSAQMFTDLAVKIGNFNTFLSENSDTIKSYGIALGIAAGVVGGYVAVTNAARVATTAWTVAQIALNSAMKLSPFGIALTAVTALTLGIGFLIDHMEEVQGYIKIAMAGAIDLFSSKIQTALFVAAKFASVFSDDIAASLNQASQDLTSYSQSLAASGRSQVDAADKARGLASETEKVNENIKGLEGQAAATQQAMIKLAGEFSKAAAAADPAIKAFKDLTPSLNLAEFQQKTAEYETQLKALRDKAKAIQIKIESSITPPSNEDMALLAQAKEEEKKATAVLKAIKIKAAQEVRAAQLKEVEIALAQERDASFSVVDEIKLKRLSAQDEMRQRAVEIRTQQIMEEQNIARQALDVETQARLDAQNVAIQNHQAFLNAKLQLSVQNELLIAQAQADARKNLVKSDPVAAAQAETQAQVAEMQVRQQQLTAAFQAGLITREQMEREQIAIAQQMREAEAAADIARNENRASMLGLSEQALQAQLETLEQQHKLRMQQIQQSADLTDAERKVAIEQAELQHQANLNSAREAQLQSELERQQKLRNSWGATMANIELQQQKHGAVMGALQATQQSAEYQALQGALSNTASLMNSGNKHAFEVGKAAAIAQTTINTFMSATAAFNALAGIPFVGPALGGVAAAAAVAAGIANIAKIRAQQFNPPSGQFDEGIDEVPKSLSGKSFVLSQGERVVQPEANKELNKAVDTINEGGGGQRFDMQFNIQGNPDDSQIDKLRDVVIKAIRDASEKGEPVINEKGIVKA